MVTAFGRRISTAEVRELGFALIDLATSMDRAAKQAAQAIAKPTPKECSEAATAANRVRDAVSTFNALLASKKQ